MNWSINFCLSIIRWGRGSRDCTACWYVSVFMRSYCNDILSVLLPAEEDTFSSYSRLLLKYFMAEGVMCGHELYLASLIEDTQELLNVCHTRE